MTAIEKQAQLAGISYKVIAEMPEISMQVVEINGKQYRMSTSGRNYGVLDNGQTVFRLLSSIANGRQRRKSNEKNS